MQPRCFAGQYCRVECIIWVCVSVSASVAGSVHAYVYVYMYVNVTYCLLCLNMYVRMDSMSVRVCGWMCLCTPFISSTSGCHPRVTVSQARQECIDRVERALRGLFPRTGHRASLVLVGSYAIGTDDIDSDVDMVACLHVSQKEVFHNHFPQVLKSAAFSVKPILTARAPVYRITDVSRNLILELQYAIFKGEIPDIEDMLKQDYKADLDVDAGKISGIEAIVHTLRLQSIIRNLPRPQQTLFMQGTLMLKSYLGNYGLTGASYGHMPSAAIAALTAYALANKDIQTSGGLNSFFPALLRWVADLLTQDAHEGWGEVLSLPGRTVKDEEVTNYKRASGTPQPVFVAALSMPLRNLTATVHQYHQTHTAEMLRSDALKMLEGRDMREVMAGFGEPYLDSYTAMTNYTHFVVTIVGSKKQDLSAQEQETVNELIGLKFLPIAQRLHTSSEVMGYHLLPKPVFIMQDPDSDELSVAPADDRKAYRGYLQGKNYLRDLSLLPVQEVIEETGCINHVPASCLFC